MTTAASLFSQTYIEARGRILAAAASASLQVDSRPQPLPGRDGEALSIDAVVDGSPDAQRVLLVSRACHGVEGFCGSAVQSMLLLDDDFLAACRASGVSVRYLHALNPHGFSWWRRTTHKTST